MAKWWIVLRRKRETKRMSRYWMEFCENHKLANVLLKLRVELSIVGLTSLSGLLGFVQCRRWKQCRECLYQGCLPRINVAENTHIDVDHLLWFGWLFVVFWRSRCGCCRWSRAPIVRSHCIFLAFFNQIEALLQCWVVDNLEGYRLPMNIVSDILHESNIKSLFHIIDHVKLKDCETWHIKLSLEKLFLSLIYFCFDWLSSKEYFQLKIGIHPWAEFY